MKVSALLESMPGVGKVRAQQIMERLGIAETRRVRGLGAHQRAALEREFGSDSRPALTGRGQGTCRDWQHCAALPCRPRSPSA